MSAAEAACVAASAALAHFAVKALKRVRRSWETCRARRLSGGDKLGTHAAGLAGGPTDDSNRWAMALAASSSLASAVREDLLGELAAVVTAFLHLGPVSRGTRIKLVLDLDETLVHTFVGATPLLMRLGGVECAPVTVILSNQFVHINVALRPHLRDFLRLASQWFDLAVFTAGDRSYADPIIDFLDDGNGILKERYYRQHCQTVGGYHLKDLRVVSSDLSRIAIIDDNEAGALLNPNNCIGIRSWQFNPLDRALLDLLPGLAVLSRAPTTVAAVLSCE
ncbi:CTD nuclear envelope phosphatase 1-like [Hondaea fermentalgiana]|uniref:CTD nuclear envelope phosphatase 1-like n=1 Tax=Hondaea fermentalgiana TaxID=2315210 RepID=A0A2R5GFX3_9STRA|nr:CTD nuclear envelope phosphatase 1-like [Hondaea fermentalgiana]|eukprot:GBG27543.1 CTD nuclear envelope phosphatase 1-like [Hondaea fermentalgiana]